MDGLILLDPMFRVPFANGLLLAIALSLLGAYLRMRDEWLAAFGMAQMAAAGGVFGLLAGIPVVLGATLAAGGAALVHGAMRASDNSRHAVTLLLGWSLALFLAAHTHQGSVVAESMLRGQLYFSAAGHLVAAVALLALVSVTLPWMSRRLMIARFFPDHFSANHIRIWPVQWLFGIQVVFAAVLGTLVMGAFPAFALFFVPAWVAFKVSRGWRTALLATITLAVLGYLGSFAIALLFDLPFGATLTLALVTLTIIRPAHHFLAASNRAPGAGDTRRKTRWHSSDGQ